MSTMYKREPGKYCGPHKKLCKNRPKPYSLDAMAELKPPSEGGEFWVDGINTFVEKNKAQGLKHLENYDALIGKYLCSTNVPYDKNCCTTGSPCGKDKGGCDSDNHCKDGLKCGKNNCPSGFNFPDDANCCTPGDH